MTREETKQRRLDLAEQFLESAEHSSEAAMRNSLSRMYYAVYHLAFAVFGKMAHGEYPSAIDELEPGLGESFRRLQKLRSEADYTPEFIASQFGDRRARRSAFLGRLEEGRELYERLLELVIRDADHRAD